MARLGILAALIASLLAACGSAPAAVTGPPSSPASEVDGLPVMSVADADKLLRAGKLDGQAVAVAGYYNAMALPCPYPGRYIGPFEEWCRLVAFTDTREGAQLCQSTDANGVGCRQASDPNLAPYFVSDSSGDAGAFLTGGASGAPAALVLIGHGGDARQWQCTAATQAKCARAFVVDRIASADGHAVSPAAPQTADLQTGTPITPRMTVAQVAAATGSGDDLLTAAPFRAGDIATVDPRWNLAGDNVVWLARSLGPALAGSPGTRPEIVWLVDDATGTVLDSHPLELAPDYQPARLWQMATAHGLDCCAGNVLAYYRVESSENTVVYEGMVPGGSSGGADATTFGGGYGSGPLVLPAGDYSITAWLAPNSNGVVGAPRHECSMQVTLRPLDDLAFNADFPANEKCTLQPAPAQTGGS